jgi:Yip1 domain
METATTRQIEVTPPPTPKLNEAQRLLNVFFAPTKTFEDIRRSANWLGPFVVLIISSFLFTFCAANRVGWPQITENNMKLASPAQQERMQSQMEKATPEQREQQRNMTMKITQGISYGFPVFILIFSAFFAGVYLLVMNFGLGAELKFNQVMAIGLYSGLVKVIMVAVAIVGLWTFIDPSDFSIQMPLATNPAAFISITDHPALFKFLSVFDIFPTWSTALTGLGLAVLSRKSLGACMTVAFAVLIGFGTIAAAFALI